VSERISFTVTREHESFRADKLIAAELPELSRAYIQRMIGDGLALLNGKPLLKSAKPRAGDIVTVELPPLKSPAAMPQDIPLDIRYEDDDLLAVNKPRGMVVHPAAGNEDGTLVNALLFHCGDGLSGINGVMRPGIVHRIDKDTSGLLAVAKNDAAHRCLAEQIKEHSFTREYSAVVHGHFRDAQGTVDAPIGRSEKDRKKMRVTDKNAREAVTHYTVLEEYAEFSLLSVRLETGRTHQIRVHMAHIGHAVVGDMVYGPKNGVASLHGQCLHAGLLGFRHPHDGKYVEVTAGLPDYFTGFLTKIRG